MRAIARPVAHASCVRSLRLFALTAACALAACGGGGSDSAAPPPAPPSKAFAADPSQLAIGSVVNPNPAAGALPVDRIIMGPNTGLTNNPLTNLFLDATNDRLYVGSGTSILVFNDASMASGNVSPARKVTGLNQVDSLFLDAAADRLYVGDAVVGVRVYDGASGINGAAAATRLIDRSGLGSLSEIFGVAVDTGRDILYVSATSNDVNSTNHINVFASASTANGSPAPNRKIVPTISNVIQPVRGISLDAAHDRIYVAGDYLNQVMVFDGASVASGQTAPTKVIALPSTYGSISNVWVDAANDRLYAVSFGAIYIVENASGTPGTAKAAIAPGGGGFSAVAVAP
jgi:hypothetical protein